MNVYVVSTGEYGEGDTAEAVFDSLLAAKQYVSETYNVAPIHRTNGVWMSHRNATDLVWIYRFPLRTRR